MYIAFYLTFTFYCSSIKPSDYFYLCNIHSYLHSTVVLLNRFVGGYLDIAVIYLHSTVVLLNRSNLL